MLAYRADIDGLRAIAVVSVVLFHAGLSTFGGGFVGVDVFFVLSGFLITSIIAGDLQRDRFSIATFYERRIRRIFPPLFVVLFASFALGWFLLLPDELLGLAKSIVAATAFVANVLFYGEIDYFAPASESKPLLHTWSLCVEEQFYLVFPPLMAGLHRYAPKSIRGVLLLLFAASLAASQWHLRSEEEASFFLPHLRAFELLTGALLALGVVAPLATSLSREVVALVGLCAVLFAVFMYTPSTPFPGAYALVPCVGTALLIHTGGGEGTRISRLLGRKPFVSIGLISYGLYLWHWPLLVFARIWAVRALSPLEVAFALGLAVLLSLASYRWLETPIRRARWLKSSKAAFAFGGVTMAAAFALGGYAVWDKGSPGRVPEEALVLAQKGRGTSRSILRRHCRPADPALGLPPDACIAGRAEVSPSFLLWGDSHAAAILPAVAAASEAVGRAGLVTVTAGCPPITGVWLHGNRSWCKGARKRAARLLRHDGITDVVLSARWALSVEGSRYKTELGRTRVLNDARTSRSTPRNNPAVVERGLSDVLRTIERVGKRAIVIASVPEVGYQTADVLARLTWWRRPFDIRPTAAEYEVRQRRTTAMLTRLQKQYGFSLIYPHHTLCATSHCQIAQGATLLYKDGDHLTAEGAALLVPSLRRALVARQP